MNPNSRRVEIDLAAAHYFDALQREDFDAMADMWQRALLDPELHSVIRQVHAGLIEEHAREERAPASSVLSAAVETYMPSAEIVHHKLGPVTVAEVAEELFRHTPDQLPAAAHVLNERLRTAPEGLPEELGLAPLTAWAEKRFGKAPPEYWKVFRQAALKLELRRAAEAEYQLAARRAPKSGDTR
jgi:hypothetical protein